MSGSYARGAKDGSWPTRVAFLKLMSVLGATTKGLRQVRIHPFPTESHDPETLKTTVKQILPEINDTLRDNENSEVRMAGVQLLSISAIKGSVAWLGTIPTDTLTKNYLPLSSTLLFPPS